MTGFLDETRIAGQSLLDAARGLSLPTLRLGVTGLSRAGKTVFITALVHSLIEAAAPSASGQPRPPLLPRFAPVAGRRLLAATLAPQPDPAIARFAYEAHVAALTGTERHWPEGTSRIAELRLVLNYESASFLKRNLGPGRLAIDIVDYPGEWLLDLVLLEQSYQRWSAETWALAEQPARAALAAPWRSFVEALPANQPADEAVAQEAARRFTAYLRACRTAEVSLAFTTPGRFLMPGELEGSPALTFAPLPLAGEARPGRASLAALMAERYQAYKDHVVRPFFRDHFARLDRQIVLVDLLAALNAGPAAVADLERALDGILAAFRVGAGTWLGRLIRPTIDRVVLAATKADHLHHTSHDRLETILAHLTRQATLRARAAGAGVEVLALASLRATREASIAQGSEMLPCIVGTPEAGQRIGTRIFDGQSEMAIFPGDLPIDPSAVWRTDGPGATQGHFGFTRFRPPLVQRGGDSAVLTLPHIRLDRALALLLEDRLA